jgi:subtilisin family serine protease
VKAADSKNYVPGRLLAGHRDGSDPAVRDRVLKLHGATVRRQVPELGFTVIDVAEESSEAVLASLTRSGLFSYVERDAYAHTAAVPNDPSYGSQWHLPKIQGPEAWSLTTGSSSIVVAIIDSGVNAAHPDLAPKLLPGWNFVKNNANAADVLGHGTAVAGTAAPVSNNRIGVAGVNWASRLLPVAVVDENDFAAYSNIAAGIQYAADRGARVINISIGGPASSVTLQNAVDYAWKKGAVLFASAMNDGAATPNYPAACARVVAVSATDSNDRLASFSNYGNWITLAAPGTNILTTTGGGYGYWSGTSFASPIAAGVAALCLAVNPALTNADVVAMLEKTADDIGPPGRDDSFGWGRVNAFRAVSAALETLPKPSPVIPHSPRPYMPKVK